MQSQESATRKIPASVDAELDRLADLVEARQAVRRARENLSAYTLMSAKRIEFLKATLADTEARVVDLVQS